MVEKEENMSERKSEITTCLFSLQKKTYPHCPGHRSTHISSMLAFTIMKQMIPGHHSLCNRDGFTNWSLQTVLQNVRYDRPPRALPAILLIISTFTSIIMWFPLPSYSVITQRLLIRSYVIDHSTLTGMKVYGCSLIYHNSKLSHHSVGYQLLQLE